ncbi:hypothetical protein ACFZDK_52815 [Streptomyces sp. NPDC007901]
MTCRSVMTPRALVHEFLGDPQADARRAADDHGDLVALDTAEPGPRLLVA